MKDIFVPPSVPSGYDRSFGVTVNHDAVRDALIRVVDPNRSMPWLHQKDVSLSIEDRGDEFVLGFNE